MDLTEGVGESSSPPRSFGNFSLSEIKNEVHKRLLELRNEEACYNPEFRERLDAHFNRLPTRYALDINLDRVEDVLLHQKLLVLAKEADNQPAFHVRFLEDFWTRSDGNDEKQVHDFLRQGPYIAVDSEGAVQSHDRNHEIDFEPCSKLEDLNLEVRWNSIDMERQSLEGSSRRQEISQVPVYEVIFSTVDKPKLLSQLSALLSDIGLNIREAHVFSTTDGYSLDVFVVDGWPIWETQRLHEAMENAIARSEGSWSSQLAVEKALVAKTEFGDWEIDRRMLKIGEKIASGACGDLHRGAYLGEDVAVKMLRSEQQTEKDEFLQEVSILREVKHENVIRLIGVCTKSSPSCIITEYMAGGSLYEYLRKNGAVMELPQLVKFAIDVSKGMEYLHQQNIIHRDLKTANLLIDAHNVEAYIVDTLSKIIVPNDKFKRLRLELYLMFELVVKVADFGIARFRNEGDVMTAETGTYRWMAPEILNNQQYDQRADIFSFAIVLWELVTAKVPYDTMTPLQAALGVTRQNIRPEIPRNMHPKLLDLMQRCWDTAPAKRPSFSQIRFELEDLLQKVQEESDVPDVSTIHVQLKHP